MNKIHENQANANDLYVIGNVEKSSFKVLEIHDPELEVILNSITDGFYILNKDWQIRYWSKQAETLLGKSKSEMLGRDIWSCYPEEVGKGISKQFTKAFNNNNNTPIHFEQYFKRLNRWYSFRTYPSEQSLLVFFSDITERREKDIRLNEINERFTLLSKATSEAIWDWKTNTTECYWHGENFKNLFGYDLVDTFSPFDLWAKNIRADQRDRILAKVWEVVDKGGDIWNQEYWFKKADQTFAFVKERACIIRNDEGKAVRIIGSMSDITDQKLAEDALRNSEENYKLLFNNAPLPQFIYRVDTLKLVEVNEAALKKYGYTREEALNLTVMDFRPPEQRKLVNEYLLKVQETDQAISSIATHLLKDGNRIKVEVTITKILYKGSLCILGTIHDITQKLKLEEVVNDLNRLQVTKVSEAFISGQEKERAFLGKELHDNISQMLTTTKLYLECGVANEAVRMEMIEKSISHLSQTIQELRSLSRFPMPSMSSQFEIVDALNELVDSYKGTQKFKILFKHSGNITDIPKDIKLSLFRITQEQMNNIVKHAFANNVLIKLSVTNVTIALSIKDDGTGFDTSSKYTGGGFTNIRNRAKVFNGKVSIVSRVGSGCCLSLIIPMPASLEI